MFVYLELHESCAIALIVTRLCKAGQSLRIAKSVAVPGI